MAGVTQRYQFQHFPDKIPDPSSSDGVKLAVGNWQGVQIDECTTYGDGFIVAARADTSVIEEFLDDLYAYVEDTFGAVKVPKPTEKRHYESGLVLEADPRVAAKFDFLQGLYNDLASFHSDYGLGDIDYAFNGFQIEADPSETTSNRGMAFNLARRIGLPYEANYWFSSAPLKTADHVNVLENLERQLLRA